MSARPKSLTIFFSFSTLLYMGLGLVESCLSLEKSHNEVHITTFNGRDGDFHNGRLPGRVKQELLSSFELLRQMLRQLHCE